ncbi:MAG: DMT family transporter [Beijerinckiaceae bacterium]|nr:DMT family transporter [Beijerinckiaceae bacterium]
MLGAFLALCSAATFALNNAFARRGVLTGSALQALAISVPIGVPMFLAGAIVSGSLGAFFDFSAKSYFYLALAGILHFAWGRYCNYRAVKAIGSNLAGPLQESSVLIALFLAVVLLGETLTGLKIMGIALVLFGPLVVVEVRRNPAKKAQAAAKRSFTPLYAEGYLFAGLSALGYGCSPVLIRAAIDARGAGASLAGGTISYAAASLVVLLVILGTGSARSVTSVERENAKWFVFAGLLVGVSQMLRYMALAVAPVTVVAPIQRLSLIFRMLFGWLMNHEHEVFTLRLLGGTMVSLVGAVMLSLTVETVQTWTFLPDWLRSLAAWTSGK